MYALIWRRRSVKPQQRSPKRREFLLNSALKQSSHNIDGGSSGREEYFIKRAYTILHKRRDENQNRVITFFVWVSWRASSCLNNTIWLLSVAADSLLSVKVKHVYFKTQTQPGQRKNNNNGTQFQMASLTSWEGMTWVKKKGPGVTACSDAECKFRRSRA